VLFGTRTIVQGVVFLVAHNHGVDSDFNPSVRRFRHNSNMARQFRLPARKPRFQTAVNARMSDNANSKVQKWGQEKY